MEDKKILNNEDLEKVNGGLGNHEFEFGNTLISGTNIPGEVSGGLTELPPEIKRIIKPII